MKTNIEIAKELREIASRCKDRLIYVEPDLLLAAADIVESHEKLQKSFDRESMCHAGCGVISNANTETSLAEVMNGIHPDYLSASLQDCIRTVKREIELRAERDVLKAKVDEALERIECILSNIGIGKNRYHHKSANA